MTDGRTLTDARAQDRQQRERAARQLSALSRSVSPATAILAPPWEF